LDYKVKTKAKNGTNQSTIPIAGLQHNTIVPICCHITPAAFTTRILHNNALQESITNFLHLQLEFCTTMLDCNFKNPSPILVVPAQYFAPTQPTKIKHR